MFSADDHRFMAEAIHLAEQGLNTTDPNPRVGCVIVNDDEIVGRGFHVRAGEPHAEVHAILDAGSSARGATVYVTLEPCSHQGRTPPCADALMACGIGRVVVAMQDPNPLVAGQGVARLKTAGIQTQTGLMALQAEALNPGFIKRMRHGLPFVRVKLAMSLDGRTAMASGESVWITSPEARADVQRLRARSSAILSGVGTVLFDDPSLNVRQVGGSESVRQPLRVIMDSHLRTPATAKTLQLPGEVLIFHATSEETNAQALKDAGADLIKCQQSNDKVVLTDVLSKLAARGVNEVHVEAGARLCGALLAEGLVDECVFYMAPHLMGDDGRGLFHLPEVNKMAQRKRLKIIDVRAVGCDWRITARPESEG